MKELLESGVHFGHQTRRWNPKMAKYIFAERNGIYIIDLQKTLRMLEAACDYVQDIAAQGGTVLFVGTKRQSQESVIEEATRCQMFYVSHRWLGGMLTNFQTIRRSIQRLEKLETDETSGVFDQLPKKEVIRLAREKTKLTNNLTGIKEMKRSPDAVVITDTRKEHTAILESNKLGIPVIGIVDTNCDPQLIDFPIPGNDDAIRAIRLICSVLATSIIEGRGSASEGADVQEVVQPEATTVETSAEVDVSATDGEGELPTETAKAEATSKPPKRRKRTSAKTKKAGAETETQEGEAAVAEDSATEPETEDEVEPTPKPARRKRRSTTRTKKADAEAETQEVETTAAETTSEDSATGEKQSRLKPSLLPSLHVARGAHRQRLRRLKLRHPRSKLQRPSQLQRIVPLKKRQSRLKPSQLPSLHAAGNAQAQNPKRQTRKRLKPRHQTLKRHQPLQNQKLETRVVYNNWRFSS